MYRVHRFPTVHARQELTCQPLTSPSYLNLRSNGAMNSDLATKKVIRKEIGMENSLAPQLIAAC